MRNLKNDILTNLEDYGVKIKCAEITYLKHVFILNEDHTEDELNAFLDCLNLEYNPNMQNDELEGFICLTNEDYLDYTKVSSMPGKWRYLKWKRIK